MKLFFATIAFLKLNKKYDVVQFHYINLFVVPLEIVAKAKSSKISTFVWGSDFLRAGRFMRIYLGIAFKFADSVVCDSNDVLYELEKVYPKYKYKMKCEYFGSKIIDNMLSITNSMESKKSDKVTIMCGYNATPAQNHEQIIQSLIPFKDDVRLIFPMTYSGDEEYKKIIADLLTKEGFDFILLKSFLSDEEWVSYLLMTDIFVHMQKSDAFSSTLAENLLLGHVVLNAEWLDYKDLEVNDVYYIKVSFEKLSSLIDNILKIWINIKHWQKRIEIK